jgi:hypothetical protein
MVDAHTVATFAFAQLRRDPKFGPQFPWLRNTVVCVESDLAWDVLAGMMAHYFPDGGSVACYYPAQQRFMFVRVGARQGPDGEPPLDAIEANDRRGELTIGMLVDSVYRRQDWSHPLVFGAPVGEASTVEVEKKLALT